MDYGKMAYMKVEDLENAVRAIRGSSADAKSSFGGGNYRVNSLIVERTNLGMLTPASPNQNVCLLIKFSASVVSSGGASAVDFLLDGSPLYRKNVCNVAASGSGGSSAGAGAGLGTSFAGAGAGAGSGASFAGAGVGSGVGGLSEYVVMVQTRLDGGRMLSVRGEGVYMGELELVVIGGKASGSGKTLAGDYGDNLAVVLEQSSDEIMLYFGEENALDYSSGRLEAIGIACDVVYNGTSFIIAILDKQGNIWLKELNSEGYKWIGVGERTVALTSVGGGIAVATIREGSVVTYELGGLGDKATESRSEHTTDKATRLVFSKGETSQPVLALTGGATSTFLTATERARVPATVRVNVQTIM